MCINIQSNLMLKWLRQLDEENKALNTQEICGEIISDQIKSTIIQFTEGIQQTKAKWKKYMLRW